MSVARTVTVTLPATSGIPCTIPPPVTETHSGPLIFSNVARWAPGALSDSLYAWPTVASGSVSGPMAMPQTTIGYDWQAVQCVTLSVAVTVIVYAPARVGF